LLPNQLNIDGEYNIRHALFGINIDICFCQKVIVRICTKMNKNLSNFNAWANNPLKTRDDIVQALHQQLDPLIPAFSEDGGAVCLADSGAIFTMEAAELEGYARPLWGIVPYVFGGGEFKHWELFRKGLANGTNSNHPEYWGNIKDLSMKQQLVELAAVGFALCFVPEHIWNPLTDEAKENVSKFLLEARENEFNHCNWKFFRVMIDLGLEKVGVKFDTSLTEEYFQDLETMYIDDGWYGDGANYRIDYYNPFALHFYGMIYYFVKHDSDPERSNKYRSRAEKFAKQFMHWFSDDGACIPFGRSCIYRFAVDAFWGMIACITKPDEEPVIPWGVLKGVYLRNLRWWSKQSVSFYKTNILSVGFSYPNQFICEAYNSPQSPYWSLKAMSPLMLPESHPFWTVKEEPLRLDSSSFRVPGMLISHASGNTVALSSGPYHDFARHWAEKYCKFAYSTRYGFSVENNLKEFELATLDNMIGFSFTGKDFFFRGKNKSWIFEDGLYSEWSPVKDIEVRTWILQRGKYHIRVHNICNNTEDDMESIEGGFAISVMYKKNIQSITNPGLKSVAEISTSDDTSLLINFLDERRPRACEPDPNSNLISSKVMLPHLRGSIPAKSSANFACLVYGQPKDNSFSTNTLLNSVTIPDQRELEELKLKAQRVLCNV
jgi:hypothetical protein